MVFVVVGVAADVVTVALFVVGDRRSAQGHHGNIIADPVGESVESWRHPPAPLSPVPGFDVPGLAACQGTSIPSSVIQSVRDQTENPGHTR